MGQTEHLGHNIIRLSMCSACDGTGTVEMAMKNRMLGLWDGTV